MEVNKLRDKFNKLFYPKFILDIYVKNFVTKKVATTDETTNNKREEIIIRLPYFGDITKRLVKQLNKTMQDTGINSTVRGVFKGEQKISYCFKLQDKTSRHLQSNIVYSVKCFDCEAEFVGKITQHIDARIYQHKMVKDGQHGLTKLHITEHAQRLRHKIDRQNYSVLARASNNYYLKIKEKLLIK